MVVSKKYSGCILAEPKKGCNDIVINNIVKRIFMVPFAIFINIFAFLYVRANSKEFYEEVSFPSFFQNKMHFVESQG